MRGAQIPAAVLVGLVAALVLLAAQGGAANAQPTFVDPTATIENADNVELGHLVYVAPFARLKAGSSDEKSIHIGDESDVQDNVVVDASGGEVALGEQVILAHGSTVKSNSTIGIDGHCPDGAERCPSFVGFNAEVDGATIQKDAMVLHLARVAPGVTIPSGRKVMPGKNVASQAEVWAETEKVSPGDRVFMRDVIKVNVEFAEGYSELEHEHPSNVRGINYDPGHTEFNPDRNLPKLAGRETRDPEFRNRIIGDVRLDDGRRRLGQVQGVRDSLRADEGEPFEVGTIESMKDEFILHALEHTHMHLGDGGTYGAHSLIHGGPDPHDPTTTGDDVLIKDWAVVFRSKIGSGSTIGFKSFVQSSELEPATNVPDRTVMIDNVVVGRVEW